MRALAFADLQSSAKREPREVLLFGRRVVVRPFSKARWRKIKEILAEYGVDLDKQTVGVFAFGQRGRLPDDPTTRQQSLHNTLQIMAWYYDGTIPWREKPLTGVQAAEGWQKTLRAFEAASSMQKRMALNNEYYSLDDYRADYLTNSAVFEHVARLRKRIAELRAMGSPRVENARTRHNDYWRDLTRLWKGITAEAGPKPRQRLRRFLIACTPLAMFPGMTAQQLRGKVDGFISNRSR
jgi:hypothetical protein